MVRVFKGLILDDLHSFPSVALLMAVLADHVQLSDFILQNTETEREVTARLRKRCCKQLIPSTISAEKRKLAHGPDVTFPRETGAELVVRRM